MNNRNEKRWLLLDETLLCSCYHQFVATIEAYITVGFLSDGGDVFKSTGSFDMDKIADRVIEDFFYKDIISVNACVISF